jgi:hypothetical protein
MLGLLALTFAVCRGQAQIVHPLIPFTQVWKFDQSGRELGTAWRTNGYDDSPWPSGPGLLGTETTPAVYFIHAPIATPLVTSPSILTYYFRTTFNFTGSTNGLSLVATNLVDDGCVIYLNGVRAGAVRAPANYNASTLFGAAIPEGALDVVTFTNLTDLREGENLLAVEVHQAAEASNDIIWGMKLMAIRQTPLVVINQPQSQTVMVGSPVTLSVGVTGGPAFYRWQKNGADISAATNSSYVIANTAVGHAGDYRVIITNSLSVLTSTVATLTVLPDTIGPKAIAAFGDNGFGSNAINVKFSEPLNSTSATVRANYTLTRLGTTNTVGVSNVLYNSALGVLVRPDVSDPHWSYGADYVLTINQVADTRGNVIAPDTQIAVAWPEVTPLFGPGAIWSYHASYFLEQTIYDQPWAATNFVENAFWQSGSGPFCGGALPAPPCLDDCLTSVAYQLSPTLFRTTFDWPTELGSAAELLVDVAVDDGLVLFLNGAEIWRTNAQANPSSIRVTSYATAVQTNPSCALNVAIAVTNLLPGTNWLAAAVVQALSSPEQDTAFALALARRVFRAPPLAEAPSPMLAIEAAGPGNSVRLSWNGPGYALESTTNLSLGPASYPLGPWQQVSNMANPYTSTVPGLIRFFRLKK